jgi:hypothetical protein
MRINPKAFIALFGVLLLGACGGDASTGVNGDASGTYNLQSISGNPLPFTVATSTTSTLTFKSGTFTINRDNTFSETLDYDETISGTMSSATSTCVGTYTQRGNSFTFSEAASSDPNCGFTYGGSWNGTNAFTVNFAPGAAALYTR